MEPTLLAAAIGVGAVPVITGLVQVAKPFLPDNTAPKGKRWPPVVSLVVGVVWCSAVAAAVGSNLALAGLEGVLVGLSASGLYSTGKAFSE